MQAAGGGCQLICGFWCGTWLRRGNEQQGSQGGQGRWVNKRRRRPRSLSNKSRPASSDDCTRESRARVAFALVVAAGLPMPAAWFISAMPAPDIPEEERPWNQQCHLDEESFMVSCGADSASSAYQHESAL